VGSVGGEDVIVGGYRGGEDLPLAGCGLVGEVLAGDLGGKVLVSTTVGVDVVLARLKGMVLCVVGVVGDGSDCCRGRYSI
jgi:hypothetical protein